MNNRILLSTRMGWVLAAIFLVAGAAAAQDAKPVLREPVLGRMPPQSAWRIDYFRQVSSPSTDGPPAPAADAKPDLSVMIRKDGRTYHVRYDRELGGYQDIWVVDGVAIAIAGRGDNVAIVSPVFFPATDFSRSDFEDFEWVTAKSFVGVVSQQDVELLKFQESSTERTFSLRERFVITSMLRDQQLQREDPEGIPDAPAPILGPGKPLQEAMGWGDYVAACLTVGEQRPVSLWTDQSFVRVTIAPGGERLVIPAAVLGRIQSENEKLDRLRIKTDRRGG